MVQQGCTGGLQWIYRKAETVRKAHACLPHTNQYENVCIKKLSL